ncbi:hypothetical protein D3C75_1154110 [compost metagenome]
MGQVRKCAPVSAPIPSETLCLRDHFVPIRYAVAITIAFSIPGYASVRKQQREIYRDAEVMIAVSAFSVGHDLARFRPALRV